MTHYLIKRLLLLPITLFAIILVNFIILNLAPNDPAVLTQKSESGDATREEQSDGTAHDHQYLQFREHFGLTLPILLNPWPFIKETQLQTALQTLAHEKEKMSVKAFNKLNALWGDRARFIMPLLVQEMNSETNPLELRKVANRLLIRGGTKQGVVKPKLNPNEKRSNREIATNNLYLAQLKVLSTDSLDDLRSKGEKLRDWLEKQNQEYRFSTSHKIKILFLQTRFFRYLSKVLTLDFGSIRNDRNKSVIGEVAKRMKYSLSLALVPMLITFVFCLFFGMLMALNQNRWPDFSLNIIFLILFSIPIFIAAPFLIEKIAINHNFIFTKTPIPYSGFNSPHEIYDTLTSSGRLKDVILHLCLPLITIIYGSLAVQTRLARTAFLEVMHQDFVRTARAKGVKRLDLLIKHVGRAAAITIVTALAASLGVVLGGSLIVETIFEINGFGRFFYEAIVQRDYNVVLFSAFAGSFLTLVGYLIADISYTLLDPRITLEKSH